MEQTVELEPEQLWLPVDEDYPGAALGRAGRFKRAAHVPSHRRRRAHLLQVVSGSVAVETPMGSLVVPPQRAGWIPAGVEHSVTCLQDASVHLISYRPDAVARLPDKPAVLSMSPLLRELTEAFLRHDREQMAEGPAARIGAVILDQLAIEPAAPLFLPLPRSERLRRAVQSLRATPGGPEDLAATAALAAYSPRSFERHFAIETGLSFRAWRRQARLMKAVELLSTGLPVGDVAERLGYEQPSAFVAGFRKAFGVTPGRYFGDAR